ncbi:MAG TPA: LysR family transcriptional regulator [Ramlibacter sp.]|nr:LysR family transcriptional regulator [Ramlibacter sp.]
MDLKELEAFVHVAELGSFTRAAEVLASNQPALSRLVRRLEVELRQTLLSRNGRGAVPTDAGQVLLAHSREILQHVDRARQAMQALQGAPRQKFSLGLVPNVAKFGTVSVIQGLRTRFPRATVNVAEGVSTSLVEWLLTGRIDAAIMYDTPRSELIEKRTVYREELFLISNAARSLPARIELAQIARYPLVISSRNHAIRDLVEAQAARHRIKLDIALEVDAVPSVLELVQEGYGHAILPLNALMRQERNKQRLAVTRITKPSLHCPLVVATSRQHPLSAFATSALELLEAEILPLYVQQEKAFHERSVSELGDSP